MKLQLIGLAIALSLLQQGFGASTFLDKSLLDDPQSITNVSKYFQAAIHLAQGDPNYDGSLTLGNIPVTLTQLQLLKNIVTAIKQSPEAVTSVCSSLGSFTLAPLLHAARILEINKPIQTLMQNALVEMVCQNPSEASEVDRLLQEDPLGKVALIKAITAKAYPEKSTHTTIPITSVCLSPDAKFFLTTHEETAPAYLWKTTPHLRLLGPLPRLEGVTRKAFFNKKSDKFTIITDHAVATIAIATMLKVFKDKNEEAATVMHITNDSNTFHDVKFTEDDSRATALYKDQPPQTFCLPEGKQLPTALPPESNGCFTHFEYHPDYHSNNLVATADGSSAAIVLWHHLTGKVINVFRDPHLQNIEDLFFLKYFQDTFLSGRDHTRVTEWNCKNNKEPIRTQEAPPHTTFSAFTITTKRKYYYLQHPSIPTVASYNQDGFCLTGSGTKLTLSSENVIPHSIVAAVAMTREAQQE